MEIEQVQSENLFDAACMCNFLKDNVFSLEGDADKTLTFKDDEIWTIHNMLGQIAKAIWDIEPEPRM